MEWRHWCEMKRRSAKAPGDEALCYHAEEVTAGRWKLSGLKIHPALGDFSSTAMLKNQFHLLIGRVPTSIDICLQ